MALYGLIGKNIDYSFSRSYFNERFKKNHEDHQYLNFDIKDINEFQALFNKYKTISGFNVTIPYKERIIPFLDYLDLEAQEIGAVNTIKINSEGKLVGCNTDHYGFKKSLENNLQKNITQA